MAVGQNLVPLVNIKIAGKWMFIPLKMVLIGIDPYPYEIIHFGVPLSWRVTAGGCDAERLKLVSLQACCSSSVYMCLLLLAELMDCWLPTIVCSPRFSWKNGIMTRWRLWDIMSMFKGPESVQSIFEVNVCRSGTMGSMKRNMSACSNRTGRHVRTCRFALK